jgi:plastocyanin
VRRLPHPSGRGSSATITIVCAVLVLALFGAQATPAAEKKRAQPLPRAGGARVSIREFAFHPGKLTVNPGTKIVFANNDSTAHTATRRGSFKTGHIRPGHTASITLGRSGVYAYHCSIHNFMHGKIVVR